MKIYSQIKENNVRQLGNDRLINFWSNPDSVASMMSIDRSIHNMLMTIGYIKCIF